MYLKLEKDKPVSAKLLEFKGPKEGQYGVQHVYSLEVEGQQMDFYCSEWVSKKLTEYSLGQTVVLLKTFSQGKNYINVNPPGDITVQPQNIPESAPAQPVKVEAPDWDAIAEGKVRHGFALEAFKKEMPLNKDAKDIIDTWVTYVMTGNVPS